MLQINRFIEKVSLSEGRRLKDVVLPIDEARGLRDELAKLLSDLYGNSQKEQPEEVIQVQVVGGKFK